MLLGFYCSYRKSTVSFTGFSFVNLQSWHEIEVLLKWNFSQHLLITSWKQKNSRPKKIKCFFFFFQLKVGSYYDTEKTVQCSSKFTYEKVRQRSLQHFIEFEDLPEHKKSIRFHYNLTSFDFFGIAIQVFVLVVLINQELQNEPITTGKYYFCPLWA